MWDGWKDWQADWPTHWQALATFRCDTNSSCIQVNNPRRWMHKVYSLNLRLIFDSTVTSVLLIEELVRTESPDIRCSCRARWSYCSESSYSISSPDTSVDSPHREVNSSLSLRLHVLISFSVCMHAETHAYGGTYRAGGRCSLRKLQILQRKHTVAK